MVRMAKVLSEKEKLGEIKKMFSEIKCDIEPYPEITDTIQSIKFEDVENA
jgi:hypothetical protein